VKNFYKEKYKTLVKILEDGKTSFVHGLAELKNSKNSKILKMAILPIAI
jgi:hypothetical protein